MAMTEHIITEAREHVQRIELNRPDKKNAITVAMYEAMAAALERAGGDPAVRVILIHGQPGVFTSGNDLVDFLNAPPAGPEGPVFRFLTRISQIEKPVVAAVTGAAVGIGTTMLLHCDYVVAGESSKFSVPFVNLGLLPEGSSSLLLPLAIGRLRAAELLLFGEAIGAAQACDWGLVNRVVADAEAIPQALARAHALAAKPPAALRTSKSLLRRRLAPLIAQTMHDEGVSFTALLDSPEAKEALSAFLDKRRPDFSRF
jgi:enoyl-CoA hydratase/carnithine racemase